MMVDGVVRLQQIDSRTGEQFLVTIPKKVIRQLGLRKGDDLFVQTDGKVIVLIPQKNIKIEIKGEVYESV